MYRNARAVPPGHDWTAHQALSRPGEFSEAEAAAMGFGRADELAGIQGIASLLRDAGFQSSGSAEPQLALLAARQVLTPAGKPWTERLLLVFHERLGALEERYGPAASWPARSAGSSSATPSTSALPKASEDGGIASSVWSWMRSWIR